MAKVAIITPTKNRSALLAEAIASVRAQTFTDWEHWVIDDGSSDATESMMLQCAAEDPRILYLKRSDEPSGASVCRNLGVRRSSAEFIVFLDSDDLLEPDCLARRVSAMERNTDLDFATFQASVFTRKPNDLGRLFNSELLGDDLLRFLCLETPWQTSAPIWRRSSLLALGIFDETLLSWQDVDLHIRAIVSHCKYLRYSEVDHHVRWQHEPTKVSVEQRRSPKHLEAAPTIFKKIEDIARRKAGMTWVRQRGLCSLYFFVAERWSENRKLGKALSTWRQICHRKLGSGFLWLSGAALLCALRLPDPTGLVERIVNKWKGIVRFRINADVLNL